MATLFTSIINGELPGRFVWEDEHVVGFLTIAPISKGHTLVVPRVEVDHWLEADGSLLSHATSVAQAIGSGIQQAFDPARVAMLIVGFEIPHMHLHVLGAASEDEIKFENARPDTPGEDLDDAMRQLRAALSDLGHGRYVPSD